MCVSSRALIATLLEMWELCCSTQDVQIRASDIVGSHPELSSCLWINSSVLCKEIPRYQSQKCIAFHHDQDTVFIPSLLFKIFLIAETDLFTLAFQCPWATIQPNVSVDDPGVSSSSALAGERDGHIGMYLAAFLSTTCFPSYSWH